VDSRKQIIFRPVGVVRTNASENEIKDSTELVESTIEIFPEFTDAMKGLQGFSHILVLSYLNRLRPDQIGPLKVKPRRLLKAGLKLEELPEVGVFALDSPTRPNPIGLSLVEVLRMNETSLIVRGLDCFDGTPVMDIKPYHDNYKAENHTMPKWYRELEEKKRNTKLA